MSNRVFNDFTGQIIRAQQILTDKQLIMTTSAPPRGLPGFPAWGAGDWNLPRGLNGLQNIAKVNGIDGC